MSENLDKWETGDVCILKEDIECVNNTSYSYISAKETIIYLSHSSYGVSFTTKDQFDFDILHEYDHCSTLLINIEDMDKYVERKTDRRKRIIEEICEE